MVAKITIDDVRARYTSPPRFIGRVSFEERSTVLPCAIRNIRADGSVIFASKIRSALTEDRIAKVRLANPQIAIRELDTHNPIIQANEIFSSIRYSAEVDRLSDTIIDVSSFRREELLILLAALRAHPGSLDS